MGTSGPLVVALHGVAESSRYWGRVLNELAVDHRVLVFDLLGFGRSPWPHLGYTTEGHADVLARTLETIGVLDQPAVVMGHQAGVTVALAHTSRQPAAVRAVVALGTPWYRSAQEGRRGLRGPWWLSRWLVEHEGRARRLCRTICGGRPVVPRLARWFAPGLPPEVREDAFLHHWESLSGTLQSCWIDAQLPGRYLEFPRPVLALHGDQDLCVPVENLEDAAADRPWLSVRLAEGHGHNLAWETPGLVSALVSEACDRMALRAELVVVAPPPAQPAQAQPAQAQPTQAEATQAKPATTRRRRATKAKPEPDSQGAAGLAELLDANELTVPQAATLTRVSRRTVLSWVESGAVEARRDGPRFVLRTSSLLAHAFGPNRPSQELLNSSWLTQAETASHLGTSHATLARLTRADLPSHRVAGRRVYLKAEIDAWRRSRRP